MIVGGLVPTGLRFIFIPARGIGMRITPGEKPRLGDECKMYLDRSSWTAFVISTSSLYDVSLIP